MDVTCSLIKKNYLNNYSLGLFDLDDDNNIKLVHGIDSTKFIIKKELKVKMLNSKWNEFSAYILFFLIYENSTLSSDILLNKYLEILNDINNNIFLEYDITCDTYDTYIYTSFHLISPYKPDLWHLHT